MTSETYGNLQTFSLALDPLASTKLAALTWLHTVDGNRTALELANALEVSRVSAWKLLTEFERCAFVIRIGRGKATVWRLTETGRAALRTFQERIDSYLLTVN